MSITDLSWQHPPGIPSSTVNIYCCYHVISEPSDSTLVLLLSLNWILLGDTLLAHVHAHSFGNSAHMNHRPSR